MSDNYHQKTCDPYWTNHKSPLWFFENFSSCICDIGKDYLYYKKKYLVHYHAEKLE